MIKSRENTEKSQEMNFMYIKLIEILETSENTGSNNFLYIKLSCNFLYRKFREAAKFGRKKFRIINMSVHRQTYSSNYTLFIKKISTQEEVKP